MTRAEALDEVAVLRLLELHGGELACAHATEAEIAAIAALARTVEAQGWRVAGVYADRNTQNLRTSGPEISRLKDDAAAGEFDVVLCQYVDRITPNIWEQRDILIRLYATGLATWSVEEGSLEDLRLEYQRHLPHEDDPLGPFRRKDE